MGKIRLVEGGVHPEVIFPPGGVSRMHAVTHNMLYSVLNIPGDEGIVRYFREGECVGGNLQPLEVPLQAEYAVVVYPHTSHTASPP